MRHVYIGSAWPYVNGRLHLGHVAGLLPADLLARYHRLRGDKVLWTSGSDCHGTPITQRARAEGRTPEEIAQKYHELAKEDFDRLGFSYSLYWATMEPNHHARVQDSFLKLWNAGLIIEDDFQLARCTNCDENRADREISGMCPACGDEEARGDQCDACGTELNPDDILFPVCTICKQMDVIETETSRELFFNLPAIADDLQAWVLQQDHWRENAKQWTMSWLKEGLRPRPISRKIDWGIPIPLDGWEHRRIYVWFEAVHGYLTASMEWAEQQGNPDAWKPFWLSNSPDTLPYYVIGKDNIPFHTLLWPGILMGHGDKTLPWQIVSSEFLGLEGRALSTSGNWAIWVHEILDRYDPDFVRYYLIANGPETSDTDFTWDGFFNHVNGEINDNYGNLVQRVLGFIRKRFENRVPAPTEMDARDLELVATIDQTFEDVASLIEATHFRQAIESVMQLVQAGNQYISTREPWNEFKDDPARAATTMYVALTLCGALSVLTEPFMPFQSRRLKERLGVNWEHWSCPHLPHGTALSENTEPLFQKLDPSIVDEERERLEAQST